MRYYILQIIEYDEDGTIRNVRVTNSLKDARKWFTKQPKNYGHAYQVIND